MNTIWCGYFWGKLARIQAERSLPPHHYSPLSFRNVKSANAHGSCWCWSAVVQCLWALVVSCLENYCRKHSYRWALHCVESRRLCASVTAYPYLFSWSRHFYHHSTDERNEVLRTHVLYNYSKISLGSFRSYGNLMDFPANLKINSIKVPVIDFRCNCVKYLNKSRAN